MRDRTQSKGSEFDDNAKQKWEKSKNTGYQPGQSAAVQCLARPVALTFARAFESQLLHAQPTQKKHAQPTQKKK